MNETPASQVRSARASFYHFLSSKSQAKLFLAVFFTFAPVALLLGSRLDPQRPWYEVLTFIVFSGMIAVGWAFSFIRNLKFLVIVIPSHIMMSVLLWTFFDRPTFSVEGMGSVFLIALGYVFFINFFNTEGAKSFKLQTEMTLAKQIQVNLVPHIDQRASKLELFGNAVPSSAMGGDLLDVVEENGAVGLFVADVAGHGVQAGVLMGMIKSAIRMQLLTSSSLESLLNNLNQVVLQLQKPELLVTLACMRFDESRRVEYVLAGHLPILHYQRGGGAVGKLSKRHLPLGVLSKETYGSQSVEFSRGDLFVLLTDGLTEVVDNAGQQFGNEQIEALILENAEKPLPELYETIMTAIGEFGKQVDDQTLLLARVS